MITIHRDYFFDNKTPPSEFPHEPSQACDFTENSIPKLIFCEFYEIFHNNFFETFAQWFSTLRFKNKTTTFVYFEQFFSDFRRKILNIMLLNT